jgi:ankyrin repeat protein
MASSTSTMLMSFSAPLTTMDPLSAIGLASSIVQFIDFGLRVAKRLDELNTVNPGDVPKSLQAISSQLPLLLNALNRIKTDAQLKNLDFDTKCILRGMISGCRAQIVEVESMIDNISHAPGDNFKTKMKKVFTSMKYDEKVREIERNLQTYISVLILHHVIDSAEAPLELADDTFFDVREERVETFVERPILMKELEGCLYDAARSRVQVPTILLIAGDEGVGKTQLALEYCHRAHSRNQFRTVFWLDASTLENLYLGFESIYATVRRSTDGTRKEKISFVTGFLDDLWHPWLLVLDNYEPSALYNNIIELLPSRGYGGIILITRRDAKSGLGKVIEVPKFLPPEEQSQLNSLLAKEVQRKDFEGMKNLVNQGADVNALIWNEWPCLHRLALFGLDDAFSFFLERGANPNPPDIKIWKPIYWAAGEGNESICKMLLDNEDETRQRLKAADYQAAFNQVMEKGNLNIVKMLWHRRGKELTLNGKNQYDYTPLQSAANKGHVEIIKFLIEQGALLDDHDQGDHALIMAASEGHFEVIKLLCTEGKVDPNAMYGSDKTTALYCIAGLRDKDGREQKREDMAKFLLDKGADPNRFDEEGPLHQAATHDHPEMIRLLLEHGADPMKGGKYNHSPLQVAIHYSSPEAIKLFLQCKIRDPAGEAWLERCLLSAAAGGHRDAVLQLLRAGANINTLQEVGIYKGATALLLAIFNGEIKTAQLLIRQGEFLQMVD